MIVFSVNFIKLSLFLNNLLLGGVTEFTIRWFILLISLYTSKGPEVRPDFYHIREDKEIAVGVISLQLCFGFNYYCKIIFDNLYLCITVIITECHEAQLM